MMFALMLGGAQFSGRVLRKPSVTVYGSVAAALLYGSSAPHSGHGPGCGDKGIWERLAAGVPAEGTLRMGRSQGGNGMKQMYQTMKAAIVGKLPWIVGGHYCHSAPAGRAFLLSGGDGEQFSLHRPAFLLLMAVALLGFRSDRKRVYFLFYGVMGLFGWHTWPTVIALDISPWWRTRQISLRIMNFPIFALSFVTFFKKGKGLGKSVCAAFAINLGEIILSPPCPWLTGHPVFTPMTRCTWE